MQAVIQSLRWQGELAAVTTPELHSSLGTKTQIIIGRYILLRPIVPG